jgi:hypothetical protein
MNHHTEIQCPDCGGKIIIDPKLLLQGGGFSCATVNCGASVSLSNSSFDVANDAMEKLEKVRKG